jgi:hypothetical protein
MRTFAALAQTEICRKRKLRPGLGIAAFLFLRLIAVYALEGYWSARVREGFESLVMGKFHFGKVIEALYFPAAKYENRRPVEFFALPPFARTKRRMGHPTVFQNEE